MSATEQNPSAGRCGSQRTALLVIGPANDFPREEGAAWGMIRSTVKKNDVVAQACRA